MIALKLRSISPDRSSPGTVSPNRTRTDTSTIGNAERKRFKRWVEALHNAKAQLPANDSILGANCLQGALERSECRTSMLQKQHTCLSNGDLARGAFDEPRPEFFFQFLNRV